MNSVKLLEYADLDSACDSAASAYKSYPLFTYLLNKKCSEKQIKQILFSSLRAAKRNMVGLSFGKSDEAVAIFIKPGYKGTPAIPFLFCGGFKLILKNSFGVVFRLLNYENYAMKLKTKYADENCWYLYSLTVHPQYQKTGLASKVILPMLDFFDATGQSCYLETNKYCNVLMYEHFGFEIMESGSIPNTDIPHYAMLRTPKK